MKVRFICLIILALAVASLAGCGGGYKTGTYGEVFEDARWTYKDGYTGTWRAEITANGEWFGRFSGANGTSSGLRERKGIGNAVVYLPDDANMRTATVGQNSDNGQITIRIVGPNHTGELVTGKGKTTITTTQK